MERRRFIDESVRRFLSEIGRKGGKKSKRTLTREQSQAMNAAKRLKRLRQRKVKRLEG
jgi:hypothetical protein